MYAENKTLQLPQFEQHAENIIPIKRLTLETEYAILARVQTSEAPYKPNTSSTNFCFEDI